MTCLEEKFLNLVPNALRDLVDEVKKLRQEVAKLNEKVNSETKE